MAWTQEAQDLLKASVYSTPPNLEGVVRALGQLGIPDGSLNYSEAHRFMGLIDFPEAKHKATFKAALGNAVGAQFVGVLELIESILKTRKASAAKGSIDRERKKLLSTPETKRELGYVRQSEKAAVEKAQSFEKLAKSGLVPSWSARSYRTQANNAKDQRIAAEDAYLKNRR